MRKVTLLFVILFLLFFNIGSRANNLRKIDLNIRDNELFLIFMRLENSVSLLLLDEYDSDLFIIKYKNDLNLKSNLAIFDTNPSIHFLEGKTSKLFRNTYVYLDKTKFSFRINNYTLCIYDDVYNNINECNFVYLLDVDEDFLPPSDVSIVFYDEKVSLLNLKDMFESWVDSYEINRENFTILKFDPDSYSVMVIPQATY